MNSTLKYTLFNIAMVITMLITISCKNKISTPNPIPEGLQITAPANSIHSGGSLQLTASVNYEDGSTEDVTSEAIWSISPGEAGFLNDDGLFTTLTGVVGVETIQADYQGQSASVEIEVVLAARSLSVWPAKTEVVSGKTIQLTAVAEFEDDTRDYVNDRVSWSLSRGTDGSIDDNGLFSATPGVEGFEIITASFHDLSVQSTIIVKAIVQLPIEMVTIPAGSFIMGDDLGWRPEKPAHEVYLDAFEISRYEITNEEYVDYLNEALRNDEIMTTLDAVMGKKGPYAHMTYLQLSGSAPFPEEFIYLRYANTTHPEFTVFSGYEDFPVVRLTWYGAAAFCGFYGLRLPTEAEWEKACRGGQQLSYGTQDGSISHELSNYLGTGGQDTYAGPAPVGSFPPNPYGLYDMSGNAAEWVFDAYGSDYYYFSPTQNPTGPGPLFFIGRLPNEIALFRGGSWTSYPFYCRSVYRGVTDDETDLNVLTNACFGFRVARSVE